MKGNIMLRELDINEMEEVSGGFANFVFGAAAGAFTYLVFNGSTGQDFTLTGFLASTAFGAATSGLSALGTNTARAAATALITDDVATAAIGGVFAGSAIGTERALGDPRSGLGWGGGGTSLVGSSFGGSSFGGGGGGGTIRVGTVIIEDIETESD